MTGIYWISTALPALGFIVEPAVADEAHPVNQRPPGWECRWCPKPRQQSAKLTTGIGYLSDSADKFGQYSGLDEEGSYAVGDLEVRYRGDDARYADINATELGRRTRSVRADVGRQGGYRVYLSHEQIPRLGQDTGRTPFEGSGRFLTLPADWVPAGDTADMTGLRGSLRGLKLEQERKRTEAGVSLIPFKHWQFSGRYRHETKDGKKSLGGAIGPAFSAARSAILPEPVAYETDEIELKASYAAKGFQAEFGYFGSFFKDKRRSLTWQNPFAAPDDPDGFGRLALPPDNRFHQIFGTVGHDLPKHTRVTAYLALGSMTQDETFLPFTINPDLQRDLPRNSPDAEVNTRFVDLKISSRPFARLRLMGEYKFNERDNDAPRDTYDYVIADFSDSGESRSNLPYGFRQNLFRLEAGYALPRRTDLSVGVKHDRFERTFQEADETSENRIWTKLKSRPHERIDLTLGYEYGKRRSDSYERLADIVPPQNPLLRKFFMANRERDKASAGITARLSPAWTLGANLDYSDDSYSDSSIGLKDAKDYAITLDVSYNPGSDLNTYAFYTRQEIESNQAGSLLFSSPDWVAKTTDSFDTLGIGIKWTILADLLEIGADYVYSASEGRIGIESENIPTPPLPGFNTRRNTLSLNATYRLRQDLDLRLGYLYEKFRADDWTTDSVEPDTISNLLSLGEQSPDYSVSLYSVALRMRF